VCKDIFFSATYFLYIYGMNNSDKFYETLKRDKKEGDAGESAFVRFLQSKGMVVKASSVHENKIDKIDYFAYYRGKTFSFDVKVKDQSHVWLEIKGNYNFPGSIYGKSTHFAIIYRNIGVIAVMETSDLREFVKKNVKKVFTDKTGLDVPYHVLYRRRGRKDITTKTSRKHLSEQIPSYREINVV